MKYIGNGFSVAMLPEKEVNIKITTINKKQYIEAGKTAKSIIGHPEIAKNFNLELNRESITLQKGDELFVVTPSKRPSEGKVVENGAKYEFVPESEGYTYRKVEMI